MVGRSRVLGLERALAPGAVACLVLGVGACSPASSGERPDPLPGVGFAGGAGRAGFGGGGNIAGPASGGSAAIVGGDPCVPSPVEGRAVFADQIFERLRMVRRELFSWTTDEQAAVLRQDRVLFTQTERPGMGPGYAFEVLERIAQAESQSEGAQLPSAQSRSERAQLATLLGGELFSKARFAWSEPWATRMGWPGEDYGGNLLRIVLKPEAWVVIVQQGSLSVLDLQNQPVQLAQALANPERLGAIFYQKDAFAGGPDCAGSFVSGGNGYREFIVGNLAMIEEWSLGTEQIRARLRADIEQLSSFLPRIRACPVTTSAADWNRMVVCRWNAQVDEPSELFAYEQTLAIPSDNYLAVPDRIASIIETLQGDLFEPDPLVVSPGSP